MLNTSTLNLHWLNFSQPWTTAFTGRMKYGDYTFPNTAFRLIDVSGIEESGDMAIDEFDIANTHWVGLRNYFFKRKTITIRWVLKAESKWDLQTEIDTLLTAISQEEQTLRFTRDDWVVLTAPAYATWRIDRQRYNITFVPVEITFIVMRPFMISSVRNETSFTGQSANFTSNVINTWGTYEAQPLVNVTFLTGLSSVTQVVVTLWSNTITVNESISDSDILEIDSENQDVKINDVGGKDYTGNFPVLERWNNSFEVSINWTWSADIYVQWNDTYV